MVLLANTNWYATKDQLQSEQLHLCSLGGRQVVRCGGGGGGGRSLWQRGALEKDRLRPLGVVKGTGGARARKTTLLVIIQRRVAPDALLLSSPPEPCSLKGLHSSAAADLGRCQACSLEQLEGGCVGLLGGLVRVGEG